MPTMSANGPRRIALFAVTERGAAHARALQGRFPGSVLHLPSALDRAGEVGSGDARVVSFDDSARAAVGRLFGRCDALVLFLAAGAAVRLIAPHLCDKAADPAVVCVDEAARF